MNVQSLKVFRDLARVKNFTTTARMHGVSQSAVSQILVSMERQLKAGLVERDQYSFNLTAEGKAFYTFSKQALRTFDGLQTKLEEVQRALAANIHIVSVHSIGLYNLPPCVKRFRQEFPDVNVHVGYRRASQVYEDMTRKEVDLGLVAFPMRSDNHKTVVFRHEPLVLACHPRHRLAKQEVTNLKALRGAKMVGLKPKTPTRDAVDRMLNGHCVKAEYVMQLDNIEAVKQAVEIDAGVAILPEGTIRVEIANRTLAAVRLEGEPFSPLAVIYSNGKVLTPAMQDFIELLGEPL